MSDAIKTAFEKKYNLQLGARLGFGRDGNVFLIDRNTAVKFFTEKDSFCLTGFVLLDVNRGNIRFAGPPE